MVMKVMRGYAVLTGALLALAFLATACGGSAAPEPTPTATAVATATTVATPVPAPPTLSDPTATPQLAASPSPSPAPGTPTLTPAPQTASPTVAPATDLSSRLADEAMTFLGTFTRDVSPRASATEQERAAAEFLKARFEALGYEAQLQPFEVEVRLARLSLTQQGSEESEMRGLRITRSALGEAAGPLVDVGGAFEGDLPAGGLEGKIALIQRGTITFEEKVTRVAEAGALAAVIYNNLPGSFRGTLSDQGSIPAISISRSDGAALLQLMSTGEVQATVSVTVEMQETRNVIAEKPGTGPDGGVVILGGHYDTVPDIPAANDNGAGIAAMMAIAGEVSDQTYPFTLRFIAFGSEEIGLRGSRFYIDSLGPDELEDLIAMLNFDALGTGDVAAVLGDPDLADLVLRYGQANGIEVERRQSLDEGTSSDHAPFQEAGVPFLFFLADDFSRSHTLEDRLEFIQPELLGNHAALAIGLLNSLADR
ncbi:MAG: M28 family peptidase [Chloroflexi bacterium]|nr:M28 family peptidase [Chloroflexota bacterium]